jgi:colicin import membrane protein
MSSEYEQNVAKLLNEKKEKLDYLKKDFESHKQEIEELMTEIETLLSLFENYSLGMNYFRRARGGRAGLRE